MRVCIVGSGLAGLSTAFYCTGYEATKTVVFERAPVLGGRASVVNGAEHSTRLFLDDFTHLLGILRQIPRGDGGSIYDQLRPVVRHCHTRRRGWVTTSSRRDPLRYGTRRLLSSRTIARTAFNVLRPRTAYVLDGPTDSSLLIPWVRLLEARGVAFNLHTRVRLLRSDASGVFVQSERGTERFDAVVVTAFVPDLVDLLAASGIVLPVKRIRRPSGSGKCLTIRLDPREKVLVDDAPALYAGEGLSLVVQPRHCRCVVLVTRCATTNDDVLARVRKVLDLGHDVVGVAVRNIQRPDEALYTAGYLDPQRLLAPPQSRLYFAGSYVKNRYPVDSGEGAARTAFAVARSLQSDFGLVARRR